MSLTSTTELAVDPAPARLAERTRAAAFAAFAMELHSAADVDEIVRRVLRFAPMVVACDSVTLTLHEGSRHREPPPFRSGLLSVWLCTGAEELGVLTFAAIRPFVPSDVAAARRLGSYAAGVIAGARRIANLTRAVQTSGVIGQAQGTLMERFALTADEAFAVLQRYSQDNNIKLYDVAERFVATRSPRTTGC